MDQKSEVYFTKKDCHVPKLSNKEISSHHTLVLTAGDYKLLSCGGEAFERTCFRLDVKNGKWKHHSYLKQRRAHAFGISMPNGVYVFGGSSTQIAVSRYQGLSSYLLIFVNNGLKISTFLTKKKYYFSTKYVSETSDFLCFFCTNWEAGPDIPDISWGWPGIGVLCTIHYI